MPPGSPAHQPTTTQTRERWPRRVQYTMDISQPQKPDYKPSSCHDAAWEEWPRSYSNRLMHNKLERCMIYNKKKAASPIKPTCNHSLQTCTAETSSTNSIPLSACALNECMAVSRSKGEAKCIIYIPSNASMLPNINHHAGPGMTKTYAEIPRHPLLPSVRR